MAVLRRSALYVTQDPYTYACGSPTIRRGPRGHLRVELHKAVRNRRSFMSLELPGMGFFVREKQTRPTVQHGATARTLEHDAVSSEAALRALQGAQGLRPSPESNVLA